MLLFEEINLFLVLKRLTHFVFVGGQPLPSSLVFKLQIFGRKGLDALISSGFSLLSLLCDVF